MNMMEYENVKSMSYSEYCDYLQKKNGIGLDDYFNENWVKSSKYSRTKDGLLCHHIMEDRAIYLSREEQAKKWPYEYQKKENLLYCDMLEHVLLHIMIFEHPANEEVNARDIHDNGLEVFMIPDLKRLYRGRTKDIANWEQTCFDRVKFDEDVFKVLLERWSKVERIDTRKE